MRARVAAIFAGAVLVVGCNAPAKPDGGTAAFDPKQAPVPSLCGHQAGRLVDGSLPASLISPPGNGFNAGSVDLTDPAPVAADIDGDGASETVGNVLCVWEWTVYPQGEQSLLVWEGGEVAGVIEMADVAVDSMTVTGDGRVQVTRTLCDPYILACIPVGTDTRYVTATGSGYTLASS